MIPKVSSVHCHEDGVRTVSTELRPRAVSDPDDSVEIRIKVGGTAVYLEMDRRHAEQIASDITNHFMGVDHEAEEKVVNHV